MKIDLTKRIVCLVVCLMLCMSFVACHNEQPSKPGTTVTPAEPTSNGTEPSDVFNTKKHLYFDNMGKFKIMIFSDIRMPKTVDSSIVENMERLLDQEQPDLVILGGDVHDGTIANEAELKVVLDALNAPLEEREIPWCHAFGVNTEGTEKNKTGFSRAAQMKVYQSYAYCVSVSDGDNTYGVSNYVLPVRINDKDDDPSNDRAGFHVWCMDANGYLNDYETGLEEDVLLKNKLGGKTNLDSLHYSQVLWYYDTSLALEEHNGKKTMGMMYMQVPVMQFNVIKKNPKKTSFEGNDSAAATKISAPERETGIFYTCTERGDVRGIFSGYNVENDFSGKYMNVTMGFCSTIGKTNLSSTAGARVVSVSNSGLKMETYMAYLNQ